MSFSGTIKQFKVEVKAKSDAVIQGVTYGLFSSIAQRSPVLSGRFVTAWQASNGRQGTRMPRQYLGGMIPESQAKSIAIRRLRAVTSKAEIGKDIFFTNPMDYGEDLENRASKKAPNGMVKVSVIEFHQQVRRHAAIQRNK